MEEPPACTARGSMQPKSACSACVERLLHGRCIVHTATSDIGEQSLVKAQWMRVDLCAGELLFYPPEVRQVRVGPIYDNRGFIVCVCVYVRPPTPHAHRSCPTSAIQCTARTEVLESLTNAFT